MDEFVSHACDQRLGYFAVASPESLGKALNRFPYQHQLVQHSGLGLYVIHER